MLDSSTANLIFLHAGLLAVALSNTVQLRLALPDKLLETGPFRGAEGASLLGCLPQPLKLPGKWPRLMQILSS